MDKLFDNKELIRKYLGGKMSPEENREFESRLKSDNNLKAELGELSEIYTGLTILDSIDSGHIKPEVLAAFAEQSSILDKNSHNEIKAHLDSCTECSEELELCRKADLTAKGILEKTDISFFEKIHQFLFGPRVTFRPVYGVILLIILAIPIYFSTTFMLSGRIDTITCKIESGTRALGTENNFIVKSGTKTVNLEFIIPVRNDCIYDFLLFDTEKNLKLTKHNNSPQKVFSFEVLADYLAPGINYLVVKEFKNDLEQESFELFFSVEFDD